MTKYKFQIFAFLIGLSFHLAFVILILSFPSTTSASTIARPMHNSGLVGYWNFEEGTGNSQTFDRSGRGNTGTLTSMDPLTDWVNGATSTGQALDFDGTDDYVDMGSFLPVSGAGSRTVSFWIKPTADVAGAMIAWGTAPNDFTLRMGNPYSPRLFINDLNKCEIPGNTLVSGRWSHVVFTGESNINTYKFYINGVLNFSCSTNEILATSGGGLTIAKDYVGADLVSTLDEVRVYNRALTPSEVERLYKLKNPRVAGGIDNAGLVGYWDFEEGTGIRAEDNSINNNHGTLTLGPTWTGGRVGGGLSFDGENDYVDINSAVISGTPFTLCTWYNMSASNGGTTPVWVGSTANDTNNYQFEIDSSSLIRFHTSGDTNADYTFSSSLNTWYHVCGVVSGSVKILYFNGQNVANGTFANNTVNRTAIGRKSTPTPSGYFTGKIDEVRIYDRALSATEIYNLYKGSKATVVNKTNKTKITNGLVGYWTFDGKDLYGTTALDSTSNKNNGTLTGSPAVAIGQIGQAMKFDGTDDYGTIPHSTSLEITGDITITGWVKYNTAFNPRYCFAKGDAWNSNTPWVIECDGAGTISFFHNNSTAGNGAEIASPAGSIPLLVWKQFAVVRNTAASSVNMYIDGVLVAGPTAYTITPTANGKQITLAAEEALNNFSPLVFDELRIYNRVLSADEVYQLYNSTR